MFHSARALLCSNSLREKSHAWLIEALQKAKRLREEADYYEIQ